MRFSTVTTTVGVTPKKPVVLKESGRIEPCARDSGTLEVKNTATVGTATENGAESKLFAMVPTVAVTRRTKAPLLAAVVSGKMLVGMLNTALPDALTV